MAKAILIKELNEFLDPETDFPYSVDYWDEPGKEDPFHWSVLFFGPEETPYCDGLFKAEVIFPNEYPNKGPTIKFITKIFNCNISSITGKVCVSPITYWEVTDPENGNYFPKEQKNMKEALFAVSVLFYEQNPNSPMNDDAAFLYKKEDKTEFNKKVKQWVDFYASPEYYDDLSRQSCEFTV